MALDGGRPPLVHGPHALCTTELLNLLLAGTARGNVGAYGDDGKKAEWRGEAQVGTAALETVSPWMAVSACIQFGSTQPQRGRQNCPGRRRGTGV